MGISGENNLLKLIAAVHATQVMAFIERTSGKCGTDIVAG